jgi:hypothetical protein
MSSHVCRSTLIAAALMVAAPAVAKEKDEPLKRAAQVQQVYDCRTIADNVQRLACFDRAVAALETAEAQREVTIADKETMRETRRGLFGFSLPKIKLFGSDDGEEIKEVEAVIKSISSDASGKYRFVMQDGAVWQQIDTTPVRREPASGDKVLIKVAALGSYFAKVEGQRAIRMIRVR